MGDMDRAVVEHLLDPGGANDPFAKVEECKVFADPKHQTPLWECPCRECWKLETDLNKSMDIETETYQEWKAARL